MYLLEKRENILYYSLEQKLHGYAAENKDKLINTSFLLSFSGGIDSMAMCAVLIEIKKKYPFRLGLAHINHNMHDQSGYVKDFCMKFATKNNIPFYLKDLYFFSKNNFESIARTGRYKFLKNISKKYSYDFILTAHHGNDQLETIFMKEIEGGDWTSKIGIREKNKNIRRPFLDILKKDIKIYTKNKKIFWMEDPTNKDISFKRNNVRHRLLPNAIGSNQNIKNKLLEIRKNSIKKMELSLLKIDTNIDSIFHDVSSAQLRLDRTILKIFTPEELKIFHYRYIVKKLNNTFSKKTGRFWRQFHKFINNPRTGAKFKIDKIIFLNNRKSLDVIYDYEESIKIKKIKLNNDNTWLYSKFKVQNIKDISINRDKNLFLLPCSDYQNGLYIRQWRDGDRILSSTSGKNILLSDIFINHKLSKHEKTIQPVITNKYDRILWLPGILHGKVNLADNREMKIIHWIKK